MSAALQQLKETLGDQLCSPEQVKAPEGLATGWSELDSFLFWHGFPKGALTLMTGALGTGATSLWIEAASRVINDGKWVAWVNNEIPLSPFPFSQKGVNLGRFVSIQPDESVRSPGPDSADRLAAGHSSSGRASGARDKHLFFILQELMSSTLFEFIGCDLGTEQLKEHQLRKLQAQARDANVALVFISQNANVARLASERRRSFLYTGSAASIFSLILQFEKNRVTVERCLHRQTPHRFARSLSYARFTNFSNVAASLIRESDLQQIEHARR